MTPAPVSRWRLSADDAVTLAEGDVIVPGEDSVLVTFKAPPLLAAGTLVVLMKLLRHDWPWTHWRELLLLGLLSTSVPQERNTEATAWLFSLIGNDDRENVVRTFQMGMPAPVFEGVKALIRQTIGDDWAELVRRIPGLE